MDHTIVLKTSFFLGCLLCSALAHAQSLQDQINAVAAVQSQQEARRMELLREQAAQADRAAAQQKAAQAARERARAVAEQAARDEALADKRRDQQYEDRVRDLAVRQKELELKKLEARAKREDEFIDRDLAERNARTDVVQSEADANRNISVGAKTLLQQSGIKVQVTRSDTEASSNPNGQTRSSASLQLH